MYFFAFYGVAIYIAGVEFGAGEAICVALFPISVPILIFLYLSKRLNEYQNQTVNTQGLKDHQASSEKAKQSLPEKKDAPINRW